MNRLQFVKQLAADLKTSESQADKLLTTVLCNIQQEIYSGSGEVKMHGFGTFKKYISKPRKCRNPYTGETILVPSQTSMKFKGSKTAKDVANENPV